MLNSLKSLQSQGKLARAEANFLHILTEMPGHLHAWLGLCYCASLKGDRDGALRAIETAVALAPADEDGIIDCSEALFHLHRKDAARTMLTERPGTLRLGIALGELAERQGDYEAALAAYQAAHAVDPKAVVPLRKLINLHRRCGEYAAAHAVVDRLAAINKQEEAAAWFLRGQIHSAAGQHEAAIAAFRTGLERDPLSDSGAIDLAHALRHLRRFDEAETVLSERRSTYGILLARSELALVRRDHKTALGHAAAAHALEPRKPDALQRMARIESDRGNYAAARSAADGIGRCGTEHQLTMLRCRLEVARGAADENEALHLLKEMTSLQPTDAGLLADLARQYRITGDAVSAKATLATALAYEPDNVTALTEAGDQANAQDDRPTALAHFRRLRAVAPDHVGRHIRVVRLLYDLGQDEEAQALFQATETRFGRVPEVWGEKIRTLRDKGELVHALEEARAAQTAYPAHFGHWSDRYDLELKLSPIDVVRQCLQQAPAQSRAEEVQVLAARARLAARCHDSRQAIMLLETAVARQPNNRGVLAELFRAHLRAFDIDAAASCHARLADLDAAGRRMRGRTSNASQSHEGQLLNDLRLDRHAMTDLRAIRNFAPEHRVPLLLPLVRQRPGHIPTAGMLLTALGDANMFYCRINNGGKEIRGLIPRRISQFWDDPEPPQDLLELSQSWREKNPDYEHRLFDGQTALAYLAAHFPSAVASAYRRCTDATTKADLFRLAVLVKDGGLWADMDDRCVAPLYELIPAGVEAFFWQEGTGYLCNNLLATRPSHPILRRALVTAVNAINRGDRDKVWMLTGPGLLSRSFVMEMASVGDEWKQWLQSIAVLDECEIWPRVAIHCQTSHKRFGKHWSKTAFDQSSARMMPMPASRSAA
jgi:tetratricopeptide (TPR) repeat protein